jgi:hypothetical protein
VPGRTVRILGEGSGFGVRGSGFRVQGSGFKEGNDGRDFKDFKDGGGGLTGSVGRIGPIGGLLWWEAVGCLMVLDTAGDNHYNSK